MITNYIMFGRILLKLLASPATGIQNHGCQRLRQGRGRQDAEGGAYPPGPDLPVGPCGTLPGGDPAEGAIISYENRDTLDHLAYEVYPDPEMMADLLALVKAMLAGLAQELGWE
jgi:hypothetical protein